MVSDLLNYTKLVNKKQLSFEEVDMNLLFNEVISTCTRSPEVTSAQFDVGELPVMVTNRSFMHQLFQNFISNGLKYNESNVPKIEVRHQLVGVHHQFTIRDNGIGIPGPLIEKIFEPFHRLHTDEYEGTGLGLAICQHIINYFEGSIQVDSCPGQGTTFLVSLPEKRK
jgi:signal transduction histidine kinase